MGGIDPLYEQKRDAFRVADSMTKKVDPHVLSQVLDCVDGTWSVIVTDLLLCYGMLGGTKGKLASALFNKIARSIKLRTPGEECHTKVKKGSIWSNPLRIEDIVATCTTASGLEQSIQNYRRYLNELVESNVFYRFGRNGHYAYTYERNVFSWSCFSSGEAYIYPALVKKVLASKSDLWLLFWNHSKEVGDPSVITMDSFTREFAKFIDGLLDRFPPVAKAKCRRFDEREPADLYLNEMTAIVNAMDDFKGFSENATFDLGKLPASVAKKYHQMSHTGSDDETVLSEIIPEEEGGLAPKRPVSRRFTERDMFHIERNVVEQSIEANLTADSHLNPKGTSRHLLSLLERRIKKIKGLPDDPNFVISKNLASEKLAWQKLVDALRTADLLSNTFLRDWVEWFAINCMAKKDIDSKTVLISELHKTLSRFLAIRAKDDPNSEHSTIYEDMRKRFDGIEGVESLCLKYGLFMPYNFLHVKLGEREACVIYEDMLQRLNTLPEPVRRNYLAQMVRMTYSRSARSGLLKVDGPMMDRIDKFLKINSCTGSDLGADFSPDSDIAERAFWRKIGDENKRAV